MLVVFRATGQDWATFVETLLEAWSSRPELPPLLLAGGWGWRTEALKAKLEALPVVKGTHWPVTTRAWYLVLLSNAICSKPVLSLVTLKAVWS